MPTPETPTPADEESPTEIDRLIRDLMWQRQVIDSQLKETERWSEKTDQILRAVEDLRRRSEKVRRDV